MFYVGEVKHFGQLNFFLFAIGDKGGGGRANYRLLECYFLPVQSFFNEIEDSKNI